MTIDILITGKESHVTMIDYHIHPNYSIDAEGDIEEFCEKAIRAELDEIAFTTHLDTDGKDDCFVQVKGKRIDVQSSYWLEDYEASVREANEKYADRGLKVLLGVEVDCYPGIEERLPERFYSTDFDIILGSVHLVDHIAISDGKRAPKIMRNYSLDELSEVYYGVLLDSLGLNLFDIVAHLDLYVRYGEQYYGEQVNEIWKPYISRIAQKMKKYHIGFEVNTSSWRRERSEPMPSTQIIVSLLEEGVTNVTTGSDAHTPKDVGKGIERATQLLQKVGFTAISRYEKRQRV